MPFLRAVLRAQLSLLLSSVRRRGGAAVIGLDCPQRSDAWRLARCGRLTASRAHKMLARGRGHEEALTRQRYRRQLVVEQLTGIPEPEGFVSGAMLRGRYREPEARAAYAAHTGQVVHTSGFLVHDELMAGCSLDGHVGDFDGVVEIKAPGLPMHWLYLVRRRIPAPYRAQITHHLWITGAAWCDFVSYHPKAPLVVIRFRRQDVDIAGHERAARRFLAEVGAQVEPLRALTPVEFFKAAPIDVARHVLSACTLTVEARRRERPVPIVVPRPPSWQPRLVGVR